MQFSRQSKCNEIWSWFLLLCYKNTQILIQSNHLLFLLQVNYALFNLCNRIDNVYNSDIWSGFKNCDQQSWILLFHGSFVLRICCQLITKWIYWNPIHVFLSCVLWPLSVVLYSSTKRVTVRRMAIQGKHSKGGKRGEACYLLLLLMRPRLC